MEELQISKLEYAENWTRSKFQVKVVLRGSWYIFRCNSEIALKGRQEEHSKLFILLLQVRNPLNCANIDVGGKGLSAWDIISPH